MEASEGAFDQFPRYQFLNYVSVCKRGGGRAREREAAWRVKWCGGEMEKVWFQIH